MLMISMLMHSLLIQTVYGGIGAIIPTAGAGDLHGVILMEVVTMVATILVTGVVITETTGAAMDIGDILIMDGMDHGMVADMVDTD